MEWQPIESAPRDGETVLLWAAEGVCIGFYGANAEWMVSLDAAVEPSHWMPLPMPPKE